MENLEFLNLNKVSNNSELYDPAMEIANSGDKEKADRYFQALVDYVLETNKSVENREKAIEIVHSNLGYWAGYFDHDTRRAVRKIFGSSHPVFGDTFPTPEEAFKIGIELGEKLRKDGEKFN